MMSPSVIVIDNFFDQFDEIAEGFKMFDYLSCSEFQPPPTGKWPGKRTGSIRKINPFLYRLFIKELKDKAPFLPIFGEGVEYSCVSSLQLKLAGDDDWIHSDDNVDLNALVYVSETNLSSGTSFYTKDDKEMMHVNTVCNRCVIFDSKLRHVSSNNYGSSIDDGRLIMTNFFRIRK